MCEMRPSDGLCGCDRPPVVATGQRPSGELLDDLVDFVRDHRALNKHVRADVGIGRKPELSKHPRRYAASRSTHQDPPDAGGVFVDLAFEHGSITLKVCATSMRHGAVVPGHRVEEGLVGVDAAQGRGVGMVITVGVVQLFRACPGANPAPKALSLQRALGPRPRFLAPPWRRGSQLVSSPSRARRRVAWSRARALEPRMWARSRSRASPRRGCRRPRRPSRVSPALPPLERRPCHGRGARAEQRAAASGGRRRARGSPEPHLATISKVIPRSRCCRSRASKGVIAMRPLASPGTISTRYARTGRRSSATPGAPRRTNDESGGGSPQAAPPRSWQRPRRRWEAALGVRRTCGAACLSMYGHKRPAARRSRTDLGCPTCAVRGPS